MYAVIIFSSMLAGWVIRRKSAEILKIRKQNQARRDRRYRAALSEKSWRQILEALKAGDKLPAVIVHSEGVTVR